MYINVYHSPNKSDGRFIEAITEECENLLDIEHVIVLGNFNIDVSKNNQYFKRLIKNMANLGLKQYVTEYTRITEQSKTRIDLVSSNFYILTNVHGIPKITDHQIVEIELSTTEHDENTTTDFYTRDYTQILINKIFVKC